MCTDTGADEQPDFRDISNDETCFNLVKTDKCYIYIRHFTGFTSVADKKVMDVMCYTGDIPQDKHHLNVRMYCANQTDDAKQLVRNKEHQLKGIQLGRSDQIIVDCKNTHSLQFKMKDIMEGWVIDSGTQKVLDHSVLKFHLYGSISYEMTRNTTMTGFHSNVDIFQHENEQFNEQCPITIALNINVETQGNESENEPTEDGIKKKRRTNPFLSRNERVGISILLDSNNPLGNDWRLLASSVGLDVNSIRQLEIMAHQKVIRSPTMEVLTFWEAQVNESDSNQLGELKRILECDMQRLDAAEIISK
ncbi:UNC5C-like protein [Saccoglossus kowalevskii]